MELPNVFRDFQLHQDSVFGREKGIHSPHPQKHFKADLLYHLWHWAYNFLPMIDCEMRCIPCDFKARFPCRFVQSTPQNKWFCFYPQSPWSPIPRAPCIFSIFPRNTRTDTCILKITLQENRCGFSLSQKLQLFQANGECCR